MCKEAVVMQCYVPLQHLLVVTGENNEKISIVVRHGARTENYKQEMQRWEISDRDI
jgi:hypothetical protein